MYGSNVIPTNNACFVHLIFDRLFVRFEYGLLC